MMLENLPDWVKVKAAAVAGISVPWLASLAESVGPILDAAIKLGQVGVASVTIFYIIAKWRKIKNSKKE